MSRLASVSVGVFGVAPIAAFLLTGGWGGDRPALATENATTRQDTTAIAAGRKIFEEKCFACHSIGEGPRVGPDLKDVHQRRERDWLVRWIKDPLGMAQNDSIGRALFAEWNNVPMAPPNVTDMDIGNILAYIRAASVGQAATMGGEEGPVELTDEQFARGRQIFFDRCAGCHGTLRAGATGPNIQPVRTTQIGTAALRIILTNGTAGGMPAWGRNEILDDEEIDIMARYVQLPPPDPPRRPLAEIRESWDLLVPVIDRPTWPRTDRDWQNYFGVILRDAGQVAIVDGDTYEMVSIIETGFAVHILRSSSTGRYFYAVGRDGRVSLIDLWPAEPTLVAQVQGCIDARSVDGSKYRGRGDQYLDRYLIEGCYWPPQYVVFDGGVTLRSGMGPGPQRVGARGNRRLLQGRVPYGVTDRR
jgi:nitrite reductase (NO-forming)/hydroxylamine reductase